MLAAGGKFISRQKVIAWRLLSISFVEFESAADLRTAVEKLDGREFKGTRVQCVADVSFLLPRSLCRLELTLPRRSLTCRLPVADPAPLASDEVVGTAGLLWTTTTAVVLPLAALVLAAETDPTATVTAAPVVTTTTVVATALRLAAPSMITLHPVAGMTTLTVGTTHPWTPMPMVVPTIVLPPVTSPLPVTADTLLARATHHETMSRAVAAAAVVTGK